MARSEESFGKKENQNRKEKKRKEKEQKREERKANSKDKKSWEDMMAYVDENGNITSTPPDPTKKKVIKEEDIVIGSRNVGGHDETAPTLRRGKVTFFNTSKGYGFIKDEQTQESIFVHINAMTGPIKENDMVTFDTQTGPKGLNAVNVKKV